MSSICLAKYLAPPQTLLLVNSYCAVKVSLFFYNVRWSVENFFPKLVCYLPEEGGDLETSHHYNTYAYSWMDL